MNNRQLPRMVDGLTPAVDETVSSDLRPRPAVDWPVAHADLSTVKPHFLVCTVYLRPREYNIASI